MPSVVIERPTINGQPDPRPAFNKPAYHYIRAADRVPTYAQIAAVDDPPLLVKLFNPTGIGRWWIAAYDPDTRIAFGVAELFEREAGDFSMAELCELRGLMRLPIERDIHFEPRPMSVVLAGRVGTP